MPVGQRSRQVEFVERVLTEQAGAVHGQADIRVLLEHDDIVAHLREPRRRDGPRGPGADDDYVAHEISVRTSVPWLPKSLGR